MAPIVHILSPTTMHSQRRRPSANKAPTPTNSEDHLNHNPTAAADADLCYAPAPSSFNTTIVSASASYTSHSQQQHRMQSHQEQLQLQRQQHQMELQQRIHLHQHLQVQQEHLQEQERGQRQHYFPQQQQYQRHQEQYQHHREQHQQLLLRERHGHEALAQLLQHDQFSNHEQQQQQEPHVVTANGSAYGLEREQSPNSTLHQQPSQVPLPMPPLRSYTSQGTVGTFLSFNDVACGSSNLTNQDVVDPNEINMKTWIAAALRSLDNTTKGKGNKKLSSGAYLTCALKIAHSLADQLCKLEEEEKEMKEGGEGAKHSNDVPTQHGLLWPDLVKVILHNSKGGDTGVVKGGDKTNEDISSEDNDSSKSDSFKRLESPKSLVVSPKSSKSLVSSKDMAEDEKKDCGFEGRFHPVKDQDSQSVDILEEVVPTNNDDLIFELLPEIFMGEPGGNDDDGLQENSHQEGSGSYFDDSFRSAPDVASVDLAAGYDEGINEEEGLATMDYLNISCAELQMEIQPDDQTPSPRIEDKRMYIYFLGLVFFELFSGGKRPISELGTDLLEDHDNHTDLANAMNILGAIGDDDELFGGANMDDSGHAMGLEERAGSDERTSSDERAGSDRLDESVRSYGDICTVVGTKKKSRGSTSGNAGGTALQKVRVPDASVTVEPLKSLGLPIGLCDLIGNMIDCSRGDFSGDDSYSCMKDVRKDIKLMLDFPDMYLRNLDLEKVLKVGLQMDDRVSTWYGRDAELESLKQVYLRSITDQCEVAIICGQSGRGKTSLAREFVHYAKAGDEENKTKRCICLEGKFDKLQQSNPFSPIASAFNNYCEWLTSTEGKSPIATKVSSALKLALGQEAYALVKVIPNLSKIIEGETDLEEHDANDGIEDAQKRLRYLFSQFVEALFQSHDAPILLFMDNLQWADQASIDIIKHILLASGSSSGDSSKQFFFLGCCNDIDSKRPVWTMLDSVSDFGIQTSTIELNCLDIEAVNSMISKKLNMLPRLTRPLTDIVYHKSRGNPFFVRQFILELSKENLLRPSLSRCRWVWDEEKILERELPDDIVLFLTASLNRLPSEVLSALCTLSCFGSCSGRSLIELENELELSLSDPLDHAVTEGFLNKKDEKYTFVDDRVQQAAYNLMKPEERCLHHFNYGLALCSVALRTKDDGLFLIAVGQINIGGPKAVTDEKEGLIVANYNLKAGKKAIAMSDFFSAYWFFDYGVSYLRGGHWKEHYELSLALFNGAANCALIIGEYDSLSILSEQIMHFAKCIEDKHTIFLTTVKLLIIRSNLPAAIECGIDALSDLGEDFPDECTHDVVVHFMEDTKEMLDGMSDDDLLNHKLMSDPNKIVAMKFLAKVDQPMLMIRPNDQPIVVLKMVQLSLMYGMSPISPLAIVTYGSFIASMGDVREGCRYAKLAKALLDKVRSSEVAGAVIAYSAQLMAYAEPVQSAIEFHLEGSKAAMKSGAVPWAILNGFLYDSCSYWSGKKLHLVKNQLDQTMSLIKQYKHPVLLVQLLPLYGTVSKMIGTQRRRSNPEIDAGFDSMFNTDKLERDLRVENPFQAKPHYFNIMYTAFMFRNFDDMKSASEKLSQFKSGSWIFVFSASIHTFYEGLISFWIGRKEKDEEWITKGKDAKKEIEGLEVSSSSWNFENKAKLLQAEEQYCEGNLELAETLYDSAVMSAKEHRFVNEEALANKLSGFFYLETGRQPEAKICFHHAIEKYNEWGAFGVAQSLEQLLQNLENT